MICRHVPFCITHGFCTKNILEIFICYYTCCGIVDGRVNRPVNVVRSNFVCANFSLL